MNFNLKIKWKKSVGYVFMQQIRILINPVRMTLDSEERCLPDGNYKKISNDVKK